MTLWLITETNPHEGNRHSGLAVFVEAENEDAAAEQGIRELDQERIEHGWTDTQVTSVWIAMLPGMPVAWRAELTGERVPDEFQCCGGMPSLTTVGTFDAHCATCKNYAEEQPE